MSNPDQMGKVICPQCQKAVRPRRRKVGSQVENSKFYCPRCRFSLEDLVLFGETLNDDRFGNLDLQEICEECYLFPGCPDLAEAQNCIHFLERNW